MGKLKIRYTKTDHVPYSVCVFVYLCICVFAFIHEDRLHKSSDGCNHVSDIVCLCFCQTSVC